MKKSVYQFVALALTMSLTVCNVVVAKESNKSDNQKQAIEHVKILKYGDDFNESMTFSIEEQWRNSANKRTDYFTYSYPTPQSNSVTEYVTYTKEFYNNAKDSSKRVKIELDEDGRVKGEVANVKGSNLSYDSLFEYYKSKYKESVKENSWEQLGTVEFIGKKVNKVQMKVNVGFGLYAGERTGEKVIAYLDPETGLPVKEEVYAENAKVPMIVRIFMFDTLSASNSNVFEEYGGVPLVDVKTKK
ncbi:hypothetical protein P4V86_05225 [Brevibacillus laterosporus]|uniref:hypothetical protein n=1 Tax=Brevibacillus laterosporus TaxID=1465 RepID=UPI000369233B|nr:hypothetical protein [Brevibacillus laterosporus]ATO51417.1 hypothetical protein BrL25_21335 [Brevibacillus laterosporus DSM 25]MED2002758.1 hypothetical protein [Brevibacillus laterosporus]